jgi:hypothetical protein
MCACSTGDWLSKNSVAWEKCSANFSGLPRTLCLRSVRERRSRRAGLERTAAAERVRLVGNTRPRWIAWRCMPSRWLLCTCASGALIGISWKFGPPRREICVST